MHRLSSSDQPVPDGLTDLGRVPGKAALTQRMIRTGAAALVAPAAPALDPASIQVQRRAIEGATAAVFGFLGGPAGSVDGSCAYARSVQRHADGHTGLSEQAIGHHAARGVDGAGADLPHLATIQRAFGPAHDLSGVRAHVGGAAADAAGAIGAHAYATGDRIAFATSPDLFLAAHEATHVVQQRQGVHLKGAVGQAGDAYEQHADAVAAAVVRGESVAGMLGQGTGGGALVQRKDEAPGTKGLVGALSFYAPYLDTLWRPDFVARVRDALAAAGQPCRPGLVIDLELVEAVKGFQAARGLPADGCAGAATLVALLGGKKSDYKARRGERAHAGAQDAGADADERREYQVLDLLGGSEGGGASYAALNVWDTAGLTFGRYGTVLKYGALGSILRRFVAEVARRGDKASPVGRDVAPRLQAAVPDPRAKGKSWIDAAGEYDHMSKQDAKEVMWLAQSPEFISLLFSAAQAPEIQVAEDGFHREELLADMREKTWSQLSTTLGWYVTGHAYNHGVTEYNAGKASAGGMPSGYADEAAWLQRFNLGAAAHGKKAEASFLSLSAKAERTEDEDKKVATMRANLQLAHWKENDFNAWIAAYFARFPDADAMNAATLDIPKVHYGVKVVDGQIVYTPGATNVLHGGTPAPAGAAGAGKAAGSGGGAATGPSPAASVAPSASATRGAANPGPAAHDRDGEGATAAAPAVPRPPLSASAAARAVAWYERQAERYPPSVVSEIYLAVARLVRPGQTWLTQVGAGFVDMLEIQTGGGVDVELAQAVARAQQALALSVDGKAGTATLRALLGHDPRPEADDDHGPHGAAASAPSGGLTKASAAPHADKAPPAGASPKTAEADTHAKAKQKAKGKGKHDALEVPTGDIARATKDKNGNVVFDADADAIAMSDELLTRARAHPAGQNVAAYVYYDHDRGKNGEFDAQAANGALEFDAIGVTNGHLGFGKATAVRSSQELVTAIQTLHASLLAAHRAQHPDDTSVPAYTQILNLGIYCHGTNGSRRGLKTDSHGSVELSTKEIKAFVAAIRGSLAGNVNVSLFACQVGNDTSDDPKYIKDKNGKQKKVRDGKEKNDYAATTYDGEDGSFAAMLADELGEQATVLGHTTSGHTTENYDARIFGARARAQGATGDDGTHVFNEIFPPAFITAEETRLWGSVEPTGARHEALRRLLFAYYKMVVQKVKGWKEEATWFDTGKGGEDVYGVSGHHGGYANLPPIANYYGYDPERIGGVLRDDWRSYAVEHADKLAKHGPLMPDAMVGRTGHPAPLS